MNKKEVRQTAGCFVWFFGILFIMSSLGVIFTLVTGGKLSKYFTDEDGESSFWWYKLQFWIMIISLVILLASGGKIRNLLNPNGYNDEDNEISKK